MKLNEAANSKIEAQVSDAHVVWAPRAGVRLLANLRESLGAGVTDAGIDKVKLLAPAWYWTMVYVPAQLLVIFLLVLLLMKSGLHKCLGTTTKKRMIRALRRTAGPSLAKMGLHWDDLEPVLEKIESWDELLQSYNNLDAVFESLVDSLGEKALERAHTTLVAKLRRKAEAYITSRRA